MLRYWAAVLAAALLCASSPALADITVPIAGGGSVSTCAKPLPTGSQVPCHIDVDQAGKPLAGPAIAQPGLLLSPNDASAPAALRGSFNVTVSALPTAAGVILLERSFDLGGSWSTTKSFLLTPAANGASATIATNDAAYTASTSGALSLVLFEPEAGVLYRMRAQTLAGGPITTRLSQ